MAKVRQTSALDSGNVAGFRAWTYLVETQLIASGLTRTADTGQIPLSGFASLAWPSAGAYAGYTMWRFNDPLQSVAPVYFKIEYGSSTSASIPAIRITVGQGSDGAGNITGTISGPHVSAQNGTNATLSREFMCVYNNWGLGLIIGAGGGTAGSEFGFGFMLQRTVDNTGEPTADAVIFSFTPAGASPTGLTNVRQIQFLPSLSVRVVSGDLMAILPGGLMEYTVGASPQIFPQWVALPKIRPLLFTAVSPYAGAPGTGQTFSMALVGSQSRTYICIGASLGRGYYSSPAINASNYMLWED